MSPAGDGIDGAQAPALRRELDTNPQGQGAGGEGPKAQKPGSFRQFMLASPLADLELSPPTRSVA